METVEEIAESLGKNVESEDASATAGLLENLTVSGSNTAEAEPKVETAAPPPAS